jgi:hypothetical protein
MGKFCFMHDSEGCSSSDVEQRGFVFTEEIN